jgi:hypothetical protein
MANSIRVTFAFLSPLKRASSTVITGWLNPVWANRNRKTGPNSILSHLGVIVLIPNEAAKVIFADFLPALLLHFPGGEFILPPHSLPNSIAEFPVRVLNSLLADFFIAERIIVTWSVEIDLSRLGKLRLSRS